MDKEAQLQLPMLITIRCCGCFFYMLVDCLSLIFYYVVGIMVVAAVVVVVCELFVVACLSYCCSILSLGDCENVYV